MSVTPNNLSMSGSLVRDGSFAIEQNPYNNKSSQPGQQQNQKGASPAISQPIKASQIPRPIGLCIPSSLTQGYDDLYHLQKKPRLDVRPEDILRQQQVVQQLRKQQNNMQLQGHNSQLKYLIHQQRLWHQQQQQFLQSLPQMQRDLLQRHYQQLNHQMQQKGMQQASAMNHPVDGALYTRRLLDYMYHQRQRPLDNNIAYWRKFVAEYYAPHAKKRWCFSLCNDTGDCALGVCADEATDAWHCDICCSKPGRGFEAIFETLPRLLKIKFDSGIIDELLYVDLPRGYKLPFGIIMLNFGKAVCHSVYKQSRVVCEGQLHVVFTEKLKILSWEFCVRRREELLPRALLTPMVNRLVKVSEKYQSLDAGNESYGKPENLQRKCYMLQNAASHIVKNLEHLMVNDSGFSTYFQHFKLYEVADIMKDLIDFSKLHKLGPIASLQNYPQSSPAAKLRMQQMQEMKQQSSAEGPLAKFNMLNNAMTMHWGLSSDKNNNHYTATGGQNANENVEDSGFNITSTGAMPVKPRGEGLVRNALGIGNRIPATYLSSIAEGPVPEVVQDTTILGSQRQDF